jgi:two-component system response regulator FixJ
LTLSYKSFIFAVIQVVFARVSDKRKRESDAGLSRKNQFEEEICAGESGLSVKRCGRTEDVKKHAEAGLAFQAVCPLCEWGMMANRSQTICVVDDEESIRKAITRTLKELDVEISSFGSGRECLTFLSKRRCDLLITDIKMPGIDGIELLKCVKDLIPWLPVLMVTGFGDVPLAVKALKMGASDFIEKPLERHSFLASVKKLLEKSSHVDALLGKTLTKAECHILRFIVTGQSSKDIAEQLFRSTRTVELHRQHIMRKMGVKNVVELVQRVNAMGLDLADGSQP